MQSLSLYKAAFLSKSDVMSRSAEVQYMEMQEVLLAVVGLHPRFSCTCNIKVLT